MENEIKKPVDTAEKSMSKARKEDLKQRRLKAAQREIALDIEDQQIAMWAQMQDAMKKKSILRGTIVGSEQIDLEGTASNQRNYVFAVIIYEDMFKILIPFDELYRDNPMAADYAKVKDLDGAKTMLHRQKGMIDNLFGLETPFLITNMEGDPHNYAIAGSRKQANLIIEKANYEGLIGTDRSYEEGTLHQATITALSDYGIAINIGGVDTRIQPWMISYRYIRGSADIKELFHVGQKIKVVITEVVKDEEGYHHVEVSGKAAELIEAPTKVQLFGVKTGAQTFGTITQIKPKKDDPSKLIVLLYLDAYGLPAVAKQFEYSKVGVVPKRGDKVRVVICGFAENGMTYVKCRQYDGVVASSYRFNK